jgi:hypothetical protein
VGKITEKIKFIAIVLTFLNLGLGIVGVIEKIPLIGSVAIFFFIELIILELYYLVVSYRWVDTDLKEIKKSQIELFSDLKDRIHSLEGNVGQVENEMRTGFETILLAMNKLADISEVKLAQLSEDISLAQLKISQELNEKSIAQLAIQQEFKSELKAGTSNLSLSQNQLKDQVNKKSELQLSIQEELKNELKSTANNLSLIQNEIKTQIEEKSVDQISVQQELKEELIQTASRLSLLHNEIKDQIDKKSIEQVSVQQELKEELKGVVTNLSLVQNDIKDQINEESMVQISIIEELKENIRVQKGAVDQKNSEILLEHQAMNNRIEANGKKTIELSSNVIKALDVNTSNINYNLTKQLNVTYDRIDALMSIHNLVELNAPLPIMHEWRVSSDFAHATLASLLEKGEGSVIDIGSGISTLLFGYGVKMNGGGKVISLEHNKEYYEKSKALIKAHELEEFCELYFCPLKEYVLDGEKWLWYDITDIQFPDDIALVSVDGPPGGTQYMARYPAIPILEKFITDKTSIYLDDAYRNEEAEISKKWKMKFSLSSQLIKAHKGIFKLKVND